MILLSKEQAIQDAHAYRFKLLQDIAEGKIETLDYHKERVNSLNTQPNPLGIVNRIKGKPLRSVKNHTLSLNSMCCLAAEYGGMDVSMSHYQAEKYAILIEEAESAEKIYQLCEEFLREYLEPKNRPNKDKQLPLFEQIDLYIEQEFMNDLTVQSMTVHFYMSREHLCRTYKKATGQTINGKITEVRIKEAQKFLAETSLTITEIALQVGFGSSQYFSKVFKRAMGITATEFRQRTKYHK